MSLLSKAKELEPKSDEYRSRTGWQDHPFEEVLELVVSYCKQEIGATAMVKVLSGSGKANTTYQVVAAVCTKAIRDGLLVPKVSP